MSKVCRAMRLALALAMAACIFTPPAPAQGNDTNTDKQVRILRSEVLGPSARILPRPGAGLPQGASTLSFRAFGHQFDLELQPNRRFISRLSPAQKRLIQNHELYRGRLKGQPGSWVRLARIGSELYGAVWDGRELYAIEPVRSVARFSWGPMNPQSTAPAVYRLSDIESPGIRHCGLARSEQAAQRKTALAAYGEMVGELTALATASDLKQIEIAVLGDVQFRNYYSSDPAAAALARMNIVDGIFTEQVGVIVLVPEVRIFTSANNPFTTSKPSDLLSQLADYRNDNADMRSRGLTHLFTGRDLDEDTAGIAYLGALCRARQGVGLSEGWRSMLDSALVAAHEIGHNFGAPHDGEEDSACADTPANYLMAPRLNGSQTFSPCSRTQMAPHIAAASCIVAAQIADVSVSALSTATAYLNAPFDYAIDVSSLETKAAENVTVSFTMIGTALALESATVTGGSCSSGAGVVSCQLGTIPAETTRRIQLRLRASALGTFTGIVQAEASNDRTPANNRQTMQLQVQPRAVLDLSANPVSVSAFLDDQILVAGTLTARGVDASTGVSLRFETYSMQTTSLTVEGATCTQDAYSNECTVGTLQPGESRQINLRVNLPRIGNHTVNMRAASDNASTVFRYVSVQVNPNSDIALTTADSFINATVGQPFDVSFTLTAGGRQPSTGITVTNQTNPLFAVEAASIDGQPCPVSAGTISCSLASLDAGASRTISLTVRPLQAGETTVALYADATNDQTSGNNSAGRRVEIKHPTDVEMLAPSFHYMVETRQSTFRLNILAVGRDPSRNIVVTATLPPEFTLSDARAGRGSCSISGRTATCKLDELVPNQSTGFDLDLRSDTPGEFTPTLTVSSDNDGNATNNSDTTVFQVRPLIDLSVQAPQETLNALIDNAFDVTFQVVNGPRPAPGVTATLTLSPTYFAIESMQASSGSCSQSQGYITCSLGNIEANTTANVVLRVRMLQTINGLGSYVHVDTSALDIEPNNNYRTLYFNGARPTEITVSGSSTLSATANQNFTYTLDVRNTGAGAAEQVKVDIPLPAGITYRDAIGDFNVICNQKTGGFECTVYTLQAGTTRRITATLGAGSAGSYSLTATANAFNDTNAQNNAQTTSVTVNPAATPPATSNSGGKGGGGGSFGWLMLFGLATLGAGRSVHRRGMRDAR